MRNLAGSDEPEGDPILDRLRERRDKFHHARHRLLEDTTFYLILIPERLPIEETERALKTLTGNDVHVGSLVVNRVFPDTVEGEFMRNRLEQQSEYLKEIDGRFGEKQVVRVEQEARDITEREQLEPIARQLDEAGLG